MLPYSIGGAFFLSKRGFCMKKSYSAEYLRYFTLLKFTIKMAGTVIYRAFGGLSAYWKKELKEYLDFFKSKYPLFADSIRLSISVS